jgi:hypothetical protein
MTEVVVVRLEVRFSHSDRGRQREPERLDRLCEQRRMAGALIGGEQLERLSRERFRSLTVGPWLRGWLLPVSVSVEVERDR